MGEAPEVRGYFLGCGFNSAGKYWKDGNMKEWIKKSKRILKNWEIILQWRWVLTVALFVYIHMRFYVFKCNLSKVLEDDRERKHISTQIT